MDDVWIVSIPPTWLRTNGVKEFPHGRVGFLPRGTASSALAIRRLLVWIAPDWNAKKYELNAVHLGMYVVSTCSSSVLSRILKWWIIAKGYYGDNIDCYPCPRGRYGAVAGLTAEFCSGQCEKGTYGTETALTTSQCNHFCPKGIYTPNPALLKEIKIANIEIAQ